MSDLHTNGTADRAPTGAQDDIVERLRRCPEQFPPYSVRTDAAEEIERLRTALEVAANHMWMTGAPQTTIDAIRKAVRGG
ncbi:MAG: hypothetical protein ACO3S5_07190 [Ilumatobacteraceae bacterium]